MIPGFYFIPNTGAGSKRIERPVVVLERFIFGVTLNGCSKDVDASPPEKWRVGELHKE